MFFFDYLRQRARDAVLAGVQEALDQLDPATPGQPAPAPTSVPLPAPAAPPAATAAAAAGDGLQQRLAQAAGQLGPAPATAIASRPSAPKRGRGGQPDGPAPGAGS